MFLLEVKHLKTYFYELFIVWLTRSTNMIIPVVPVIKLLFIGFFIGTLKLIYSLK